MAKIIQFENARNISKLWYVWFDEDGYQAMDMSGKNRVQAIASLPTPTPNFVQQVARNKDEAIQLVKDTQAEALLARPI